MIRKEQILSRMETLPTLPQVVVKLYAVLNNENSSASDVEAVMKTDPALTANILRMTNSPYFGAGRTIDSIRQAVALLGTKRVFEVAASASFSRIIPDTIPGYDVPADGFWTHCIAVAVIAERLALELKLKTPDLTFTAGLLHDIGKLAIGIFLADEAESVLGELADEGRSFYAAEYSVLGTDHAEIGGLLAESWQLPEKLVHLIRWHHKPSDAKKADPELDIEQERMIDLVHAADILAHAFGYGADAGGLARELDDAVVERLGIKVARLESVAADTMIQIRDLSASLSGSQEKS
jgi:putative nucleotidyltransferase with HDIG domain